MSARRTGWTLIPLICVFFIGATLLNSKEPTTEKPKATTNLLNAEAPKSEKPGQVGRYMPFPVPGADRWAMDTTNGQLWHLEGQGNQWNWKKFGMPIPELDPPVVITPDPTGKVRPKPEADFNKVPEPAPKLRQKLEESDPTQKPLPKAVPKPPKLQ